MSVMPGYAGKGQCRPRQYTDIPSSIFELLKFGKGKRHEVKIIQSEFYMIFRGFYKVPLAFAAYVMYTLSVEDVWFICQTKEVVFTDEKKKG